MLIVHKGDIFKANVEALVNPVNCVGVMGKGLALEFKNRFPENFGAYKLECQNGDMHLGTVFIYGLSIITENNKHVKNPKYIVNFPTKNHYRNKSEISSVYRGLEDMMKKIKTLNIKSVAVPALGCGEGGLNWNVVGPIMQAWLSYIDDEVDVLIYAPQNKLER